jgi:hypothetical protein
MQDAAALRAGSPPLAAGRAYFEALRHGWATAVRATGEREHLVELAQSTVRLRFAGAALEPSVLPALAPRVPRTRGDGPAATVLLWDSASGGVELSGPPWRRADVDGRSREVLAFAGAGLRTLHDPDSRFLTMYDRRERLGVFWAPSGDAVPWHERAAPLRPLLHWALTAPGRLLVHAGAVAGERGAVLLAGRSGSGKSTTVLACVAAGWGYLGDDYVVLTSRPQPVVHALYATAKLTPDSPVRDRFGDAVLPPRPDADKLVLDLASRRRASAPLLAIVVPRVAGGERAFLTPVAPTEALRALAPSTILQHPHDADGGLATMAALVRSVPTFRLDLAADVDAAPAVLRPLAYA